MSSMMISIIKVYLKHASQYNSLEIFNRYTTEFIAAHATTKILI